MSDDLGWVQDMITAADRAERYLKGLDRDGFLADDEKQSAVFGQFVIVGEAARRVSERFQAEHPEFEWRKTIGMRNRIIHGYDDIDWNLVWEIATQDLPRLARALERVIREPNS